MSDDHPVLYVVDQFGQLQPWAGECLLCQRDELRSRLAEALKANDELNAECMRLSASKEDARLHARLAEAEALLRDIYSYAEDQGMETLMDMIDTATAPDSASSQPTVESEQRMSEREAFEEWCRLNGSSHAESSDWYWRIFQAGAAWQRSIASRETGNA